MHLRNLQQITAQHEETVESSMLSVVSLSFTNVGLKRVSMIRENNNPISLFVAAHYYKYIKSKWLLGNDTTGFVVAFFAYLLIRYLLNSKKASDGVLPVQTETEFL